MSKLTLMIYYSDLMQFKLCFPITQESKFSDLKKVCVDRLNKISKLVAPGYAGIPNSFDEESYCFKDCKDMFFDDGDLLQDLLKDNETIKLVYLPNLTQQAQSQPQSTKQVTQQLNFQQQQPQQLIQQQTNTIVQKPIQQVTSITQPQIIQQNSTKQVNTTYKTEEQIQELKKEFYLDVSKLNNQEQQGDIEIEIRFIQAEDQTIKYPFKCFSHFTLLQLSESICKSLGLNEQLIVTFYNENGTPLYPGLNQMHTLTVEQIIKPLYYKQLFVIITDSKIGEKPPQKIDSSIGQHQIFVVVSGQAKVINVDLNTTTILELKQKLYHKLDTPPNLINLQYSGKYLQNENTLQQYGIQENSNIYLNYKYAYDSSFSSSYNLNFFMPYFTHYIQQTKQAIRQFRCSSLVFFANFKETNLLAIFRKLSNNNSALLLSMSYLIRNLRCSQLHCIAFEIGMLRLFFDLIVNSKKVPLQFKYDTVFDYSRYIYSQILTLKDYSKDNIKQINLQENYRFLDKTSQLTLKPILNPALLSPKPDSDDLHQKDWSLVDYDEIQLKIQNNEQNSSNVPFQQLKLIQFEWLYDQFSIRKNYSQEMLIWASKEMFSMNDFVYTLPDEWYENNVQSTNIACKIYTGIELKRNNLDPPCLTNGSDKQLLIYTGSNKDVKKPIRIYNPITGDDIPMNPDELALQQYKGISKVNSDSEESENEVKHTPQITTPPDEAIVVLFDISGSMDELFYESEDLTRMGVVKAFFNAFADRTMAYNLKNVISLVFFDDRYIEKCSFTELFILFKDLVNKAQPQGQTRLYSAINKAIESLINFRKQYPNCILRIIALTDGEDNDRFYLNPQIVAEKIKDNNIILDSFVVNDKCSGLKRITKATGGQCFCPNTLQEGLHLFEYETILSAKIRKDRPKITLKFLRDTFKKKDNKIEFDQVPVDISLPKELDQQSIHPNLLVQEISTDQKKLNQYAPNNSLKRVLKEIMTYEQQPHPHIKIFPCKQNVSFWKIILLGPEATPYQSGVYILYLRFGDDYPFKPPELRFLTSIYHCNINSQGRICHSILDRNYTPDIKILQIFEAVYGLLMTPEPDDPLDTTIASEYLQNLQLYQIKAKEHTEKNAKRPLDEVIKQIIGEQDIKLSDVELQLKIQEINQWINIQQQQQDQEQQQ